MSQINECDWVTYAPPGWMDSMPADEALDQTTYCEKLARFKVLNIDGCEFWYCAEHYDQFMLQIGRKETDPNNVLDMEGFTIDGRLIEESDFED